MALHSQGHPISKRDALLKKYLGDNADTEEGHALFHMHNSLVLSKGLLYVSTMPKGEAEGILAFGLAEDIGPYARTVLVAHNGE